MTKSEHFYSLKVSMVTVFFEQKSLKDMYTHTIARSRSLIERLIMVKEIEGYSLNTTTTFLVR